MPKWMRCLLAETMMPNPYLPQETVDYIGRRAQGAFSHPQIMYLNLLAKAAPKLYAGRILRICGAPSQITFAPSRRKGCYPASTR